jgi:hypothetical protein
MNFDPLPKIQFARAFLRNSKLGQTHTYGGRGSCLIKSEEIESVIEFKQKLELLVN